MGLISVVKKFTRFIRNGSKHSVVTGERGQLVPRDMTHFADAGDDSQPLTSDLVTSIEGVATGSEIAVGYLDQKNAGISLPGEKRIYGRNEDGVIVNEIHLKNDGSIVIKNDNATMDIAANGDFAFNGGVFRINGQRFDLHTHVNGTYAAGGDPVTGTSGTVT